MLRARRDVSAKIMNFGYAICKYINAYNYQSCHLTIGNVTSIGAYYPSMLLDVARDVA